MDATAPTCKKHCFCSYHTKNMDPFGIERTRVYFCCWCGDERTPRKPKITVKAGS